MPEKQNKLLMWMAVILVALVGLITFIEAPPPAPEEGASKFTAAYEGIEPSQINELSITAQGVGGPLRLRRGTGGAWEQVEPRPARVDARAVEELVRGLLRIELSAPLPGALTDYGLDAGTTQVRLVQADGVAHTITVGADAPVGSSTYVRLGEGAPQATQSRLSVLLTPEALDLRDRRLVDLSVSGVTQVELGGPSQGLRFVKDDHGWWVEPTTAEGPFPRTRAAGGSVDAMINTLVNLQVGAFLEGPADLPGVAPLTARLFEGESSTTLTFAPDEDETWLALSPLHPSPVQLDGAALAEILVKGPPQWFEPALLPVRPLRLERVEAELGGLKLDARRTAEGWDDPRAEALLRALDQAKVDRGRGGGAAAEAEVSGRVRLTEAGGHVEQVELLGQTLEGERSAREPGLGAPFVVSAATLAALEAALAPSGAAAP
jgi:hypothetical protein